MSLFEGLFSSDDCKKSSLFKSDSQFRANLVKESGEPHEAPKVTGSGLCSQKQLLDISDSAISIQRVLNCGDPVKELEKMMRRYTTLLREWTQWLGIWMLNPMNLNKGRAQPG